MKERHWVPEQSYQTPFRMLSTILPCVISEKIHGYVMDLFFQDHVKKFKRSLESIKRIHYYYIRCSFSKQWKIEHNNGVYSILRYSVGYDGKGIPTHWVHVYDDIIDGRREMEIGSEWYSMLTTY